MISRIAGSIGANRIVMALSMARLGDAIGNSILFVVIPLFVAKLPAPAFPLAESVRVGILISLYGLVNSVFQPFMGALSDRLGNRKLFIEGGLFLMGVGTLGFLLAHRFDDLLLLRSIQGVGVALTVPAAMALMATSTEKSTRGGSMGVYTTMRMAGLATGPLLGGFLYDRFGFSATFYAGAGFIFLGLVLVQLWIHDRPAEVSEASDEEPRPFQLIDRDLLTPGLLALGFGTFVMATAFTLMSTLETQFNARLNQTALGFGIAFSALMFSRLLLQIPLGRLSDLVGRKSLVIVGLVLMAPATMLLGVAATTQQLTAYRVFQGVASAAIAAPAFALAADLASAGGAGRQMSIITMGFGLGIAVGPLLAGVLAVAFFELPFIIGGALSLIAAWVVYHYVPETVHHEESGPMTFVGRQAPAEQE